MWPHLLASIQLRAVSCRTADYFLWCVRSYAMCRLSSYVGKISKGETNLVSPAKVNQMLIFLCVFTLRHRVLQEFSVFSYCGIWYNVEVANRCVGLPNCVTLHTVQWRYLNWSIHQRPRFSVSHKQSTGVLLCLDMFISLLNDAFNRSYCTARLMHD